MTQEEPSMDERDWLPPNVRASGIEREMKPGQVLFRSGQRTIGLFEIVSGKIRLVRTDRSGGESLLYTAAAGDTIAKASLFSSIYHCDAIAATKAVVCLYPKAAILAEFRRKPDAAQA